MSTFTTQELKDVNHEAIIKFTGVFTDGTQETDVTKVDASTLAGADGGETFHDVLISRISWSCSGAGKIQVDFDGSANATAYTLAGAGEFRGVEPSVNIPNNATDPTGDINFTTVGFAAGDMYTVILYLQKNSPGFILSTEDGTSSG